MAKHEGLNVSYQDSYVYCHVYSIGAADAFDFLLDSNFPDKSIGLSNVQTGRLGKARLYREVTSRRFDIKVDTYSGLESWPESGVFWLLFWAVAKKYARQPGMAVEKRQGLPVCAAHALSRSDASKSKRSA